MTTLTDHLIKTSADVKKWFSGIDKDYNILSMESFIADAEMDFLIPEIGQTIFDAVNAGYNSVDGLQGKLLQLFPYLQKAVVHMALNLSADSGAFRIADSGFYVTSTATNKPVSDKKLSEFKKGEERLAYKAIEQAIAFLEANVNDPAFESYKESDLHTQGRDYFINDSVIFTRFFKPMNRSALLFRAIIDAMDRAERTYILPLLGEAFFAGIKGNILAGELTDSEKALLPLIQRPLAHFTIAEAIPTLPVEFDGTNLIITSMPARGNAENVVNQAEATPQQVSNLMNKAMDIGVSELKRLRNYLILNAIDYPLYVMPDPSELVDININDDCSKNFFV